LEQRGRQVVSFYAAAMTDFSSIIALVSTLLLFFGHTILIGCKSKGKGSVPVGPSKKSQKDPSTVKPVEITASIQNEASVEHKVEAKKPEGNPDPKKKTSKKEPSPIAAFPIIPEPTPSIKKKQERLAEQDKKLKIQKGFYQEKSDDDETLEAIKSLDIEKSDEDNPKSKKKRKN